MGAKRLEVEAFKALQREKKILARFEALGYHRDEKSNNFWCLDGDHSFASVWWMSGCKSRPEHLFCLICTKRWNMYEIGGAIKQWKKRRQEKVVALPGVSLDEIFIGD